MRRLIFIVAFFAACVPESETIQRAQEVERFPELEAADPLDLTSIDLGVGLRHGEAMAMSYIGATTLADVIGVAPHAVVTLKSFDQASQTFGEFHVFPAPPEVTARGITEFRAENTSNAFFGQRVTDIVSEIADAESNGGASFESTSVILDVWRYKNDWYIRWDGNLETNENVTGKGPYGFNREDMVEDLLNEIEEAAAAATPEYFIVGDNMEQLIAQTTGEGLAPAEFSNFLAFYKEAVARVKAGSPNTKVGCGINYDSFVEAIVPRFERDGDDTNALMDRAFNAVIMPCAELGDIIALSSYRTPNPDSIPLPTGATEVVDAYQFLRRVGDLYGTDAPIVWYSVGSPITTPVNDVRQRNYLEEFVEWTAGTNTAFVAWRFAMNLDGSDTANQTPTGQCQAFTEDARDFKLPTSHCYDGLFKSTFSEKEAFDFLVENAN